jgi:hypothetical protein
MSVRRRVQFFIAHTEPDEHGVRAPYDPMTALAHIDSLPWQDRYDGADERILRLWPRAGARSGMLGSIRRTALPPVDRGAEIGDLGLGPEEGIIEETFFTVFDRRYLGVVRNQYGPGVSRLADYLDNMCPELHPSVDFLPLARADTVEQLRRIDALRVITLKVHRDAISELRNDEPTLYELLDPSRQMTEDVELIELNLSVGRRENVSLGSRLVRLVQRLSRRDDLTDLATRFAITFDDLDGDRQSINVLDNRLMSEQQVATTSERAGRLLDSSAYDAIQIAYESLRDDLETAAALQAVD